MLLEPGAKLKLGTDAARPPCSRLLGFAERLEDRDDIVQGLLEERHDRRRLPPIAAHADNGDLSQRWIILHRREHAEAVEPRHPVVEEHCVRAQAILEKAQILSNVP